MKERKHRKQEKNGRVCTEFGAKQTTNAVSELDEVINKCFRGPVANQSSDFSLSSEMQTINSLSDQFQILSNNCQKSEPKLNVRDFPTDRAANSIIPVCIENFSFVTEAESEDESKPEMLNHNSVEWISDFPDIKSRIKHILAKIEEIEEPRRIMFVDGKWKAKQLTESEFS